MRRMCTRILFVALALTPGIAAGQALDIFNPNEPFVTGPPPGATAPATSVTDGPRVVLYDNGPLVTHPAGGGGGADASAVQSALSMSLYGFGWQNNLGNRMADDFVVTDPAGWQIDDITFFGYQTGSTTTSTYTGVFVQIWDGPPNAGGTVVWGDQTTNRLLTTGWSNIYRVLDTNLPDTNRPIMEVVASVGITLAPGTYWLDFSATGSLTSGPWAPPISILGTTVTGNALQYTTSSGAWGPANDTGSGSQQGMPFIINGDVAGPPPGTFYVIDEGANELYIVNPLTAAATFVGATIEDPSLSGMAFDTSTGRFYVSDVTIPTVGWGLGMLDEITGEIRIVGPHVTTTDVHGLAYDSFHDVLYGADIVCSGGGLSIIDRSTGEATCFGSFGGFDVQAIAYDSSTDILYGVDGSALYVINRGTGAAAGVGSLGITIGHYLSGLEYHSDLDMLLLTTNGGDLYEVNRGTGAASLIGNMGIISASSSAFVPEGFRAPAFRPFPGVLWDNGDTDRSNALSNGFPPALPDRRSVIDDFTIPTGDTWTLRHFRWYHVWNLGATGGGNGVEILIRANDPNGGGTGIDGPGGVIATANTTFLAGTGTDRVLYGRPLIMSIAEFDPIMLGAGRYWVEWAIVGDENNFAAINGKAIRDNEAWVSWPDIGYPLSPVSVAHGIECDFAWALGEIDIGLFADNFEDGTLSAWSSWSP